MKVYPVGARILPKTATTGSSGPGGTGGAPVFMVKNDLQKFNKIYFSFPKLKQTKIIMYFQVAASMSQNLMRVARTTAQTVTLTSGGYLA